MFFSQKTKTKSNSATMKSIPRDATRSESLYTLKHKSEWLVLHFNKRVHVYGINAQSEKDQGGYAHTFSLFGDC